MMAASYLPVLILLVLAVITALAFLAGAMFLGPKGKFPEKMEPFECGEEQIVSPSLRFPVKFYMTALLFVVFDIEAVFLYPWAVLFQELGWMGLVEMALFLGVLGIGLAYVWKRGALDWDR
jgi:NADH-quinone oxidoreductase subunit A